MSKVTAKSKTGDVYCAMKVKPHNRYILFFVLERELILQQNDPTYDPFDMRAPDSVVTGYEGIEMPNELPKRYRALVLPPGWYLPSRIKRRSHKESHGLRSFADLSRRVAQNYKTIDKETFNFIDAVAKSLLKRRREIKARGEMKSLPPKTIIVPSFPNVDTASSTAVTMPNRLEHSKTITQELVHASTPLGLEKKTTPPVKSVCRVSNAKCGLETNYDVSIMVESRPVGKMQVDPENFKTIMLPADRPRTFIMTCVPCCEDSETSVGSPSSASSVCSRSSLPSPVSLEDLSTSDDISDHDIVRMWMSA